MTTLLFGTTKNVVVVMYAPTNEVVVRQAIIYWNLEMLIF